MAADSSMEMRSEVWQWLQSMKVVPSEQIQPVVWTGDLLNRVISGLLPLQVLYRLVPTASSNSSGGRTEGTPIARLHNWNEIARSLAAHSMPMDPDIKTLIVAGDSAVAIEWINELHRKLTARSKDSSSEGSGSKPSSAGSDVSESPDSPFLRPIDFAFIHPGSSPGVPTTQPPSIPPKPNSIRRESPSRGGGGGGGHLVLPPVASATKDNRHTVMDRPVSSKSSVVSGGAVDEWHKHAWADRATSSWRQVRRWLVNELSEQLPTALDDADELLPQSGDTSWCPSLVDLFRSGHHDRFEPPIRWLNRMVTQVTQIVPMITDHPGLLLFLETLRPAVALSPSVGIVSAALEALHAVISRLPSHLVDTTWSWLTSSASGPESAGLSALLACYRRHVQSTPSGASAGLLRDSIFRFIALVSIGHMFELFAIHLQKVLSAPGDFMPFARELVVTMTADSTTRESLLADDVLDLVIEYALHHARHPTANEDPSTPGDSLPASIGTGHVRSAISSHPGPEVDRSKQQVQSAALRLLTELWVRLPAQLDLRPEMCRVILQLLRSGARSTSQSMQLTSLACMFDLLPTLTLHQNPLAVIVFKYLVFQMVEGQPSAGVNGDSFIDTNTLAPPLPAHAAPTAPSSLSAVVHDFLAHNLLRSLASNAQLPVHVMVEPLVKHHSSHGTGVRDFDFFTALAKHRRLPLRHALLLMHLLGKIALNHSGLSAHALPIFASLIERYRLRRPMKEYVRKYLQVALSLFMRATAAAMVSKGGPALEADANQRQLALNVATRLAHMNLPLITLPLKRLLTSVIAEYQALYRKDHPGLTALAHYVSVTPLREPPDEDDEIEQPVRPTPPPSIEPIPSSSPITKLAPPASRSKASTPSNIPTSTTVATTRAKLMETASAIGQATTAVLASLPPAGPPRDRERARAKASSSKTRKADEGEDEMDVSMSVEDFGAMQREQAAKRKREKRLAAVAAQPTTIKKQSSSATRAGSDQVKDRAQQEIELLKQRRAEKLAKKAQEEKEEKDRQAKLYQKLRRQAELNRQRAMMEAKQRAEAEKKAEVSPAVIAPVTAKPAKKVRLPVIGAESKHSDHHTPSIGVNGRPEEKRLSPAPAIDAAISKTSERKYPSAVHSLLTRVYRRPISRLFKLYAGKSSKAGGGVSSFDSMGKASRSMALNEFIRFLNDVAIIPRLVSKDGAAKLFRHVVHKNSKPDSNSIDFDLDQFTRSLWYIVSYLELNDRLLQLPALAHLNGVRHPVADSNTTKPTDDNDEQATDDTSSIPNDGRPLDPEVVKMAALLYLICANSQTAGIGDASMWRNSKGRLLSDILEGVAEPIPSPSTAVDKVAIHDDITQQAAVVPPIDSESVGSGIVSRPELGRPVSSRSVYSDVSTITAGGGRHRRHDSEEEYHGVTKAERQLIRRLNKLLAVNPHAQLPPNYDRVAIRKRMVRYEMPVLNPNEIHFEAKSIVIPLLDQLLSSTVGCRAFQPVYQTVTVYRARPKPGVVIDSKQEEIETKMTKEAKARQAMLKKQVEQYKAEMIERARLQQEEADKKAAEDAKSERLRRKRLAKKREKERAQLSEYHQRQAAEQEIRLAAQREEAEAEKRERQANVMRYKERLKERGASASNVVDVDDENTMENKIAASEAVPRGRQQELIDDQTMMEATSPSKGMDQPMEVSETVSVVTPEGIQSRSLLPDTTMEFVVMQRPPSSTSATSSEAPPTGNSVPAESSTMVKATQSRPQSVTSSRNQVINAIGSIPTSAVTETVPAVAILPIVSSRPSSIAGERKDEVAKPKTSSSSRRTTASGRRTASRPTTTTAATRAEVTTTTKEENSRVATEPVNMIEPSITVDEDVQRRQQEEAIAAENERLRAFAEAEKRARDEDEAAKAAAAEAAALMAEEARIADALEKERKAKARKPPRNETVINPEGDKEKWEIMDRSISLLPTDQLPLAALAEAAGIESTRSKPADPLLPSEPQMAAAESGVPPSSPNGTNTTEIAIENNNSGSGSGTSKRGSGHKSKPSSRATSATSSRAGSAGPRPYPYK